ncbi:MAG: indole-3-glycerol phosphate synthase TrpC [Oscillospiraceae bacterium]|nr:indole-3-glycerol phosphate synthase TrpC [Oscillospiraceae bacterium]
MNILEQIAARTRTRIEEQKKRMPLQRPSVNSSSVFHFEKALKKQNDISFICEVKKASPSKGVICEDFDYIKIAKAYVEAGADAISVLTEPYWFKGSDAYLEEISKTVNVLDTPLLRKDFVVDEYMIYEARLLGASAVLLIVALLDSKTLKGYIELCHDMGLSALVETHDEDEVKIALEAGARIIGVNNRNLKTFEVDIKLSERLRKLVPLNICFVSESGIKTREDVQSLIQIGADAVLIGETLMKGGTLGDLR